MTSVIPGSERVPNVLPTASGIINKRKRKKKGKQMKTKNLFQRLCEQYIAKKYTTTTGV